MPARRAAQPEPSPDPTVAIIGGGSIGRSLLKGLVKAAFTSPARIRVTARSPERRRSLEAEFGPRGVVVLDDNRRAIAGAGIVILCVKPQSFAEVARDLRGRIGAGQLLISVLAGKTTAAIEADLRGGKGPRLAVVRVMPNIPVVVDAGCSPYARGDHVSDGQAALVHRIFSAVGEALEVKEEHMDAVTGLSGSGPAYVYMMIEALADGGVQMGLPRHIALRLAAQTIYGAGLVVKETGLHPAILREQVTTPGGTTISATTDLEKHGLRPMLISAVITATQRSRDLGR
jgi:pyrroline-5-carboxylate reductase